MSSSSHNWQACLAFYASDLFRDVQMAKLFPDSKTFADAIVKTSLQQAVSAYQSELKRCKENEETIDLAGFVQQHFVLPSSQNATSNQMFSNASEYIDHMWHVLTRAPDTQHKDSLIALSRPYIVPGGRFREIYYWDSYFTALGLLDAGRTDIAVNMLENFVDILNEVGCIPNGNRAYYYSRSQPPMLALFFNLLKPYLSSAQTQYVIEGLKKEYAFWMKGSEDFAVLSSSKQTSASLRVVKMPCNTLLNRYFDTETTPRPESYSEDIEIAEHIDANKVEFYQHIRAACESGWDFSSRWLKQPNELASIRTTEIVPVDLNCLLYTLEDTLANVCTGSDQVFYKKAAKGRTKAINTYLYNEEKGGYFDYHYPSNSQTNVVSAAMTVPLFVGIASHEQAARVNATVCDSLLKAGGVVTTTQSTPQQWDAPNGWAPLQYFTVQGFLNYGFEECAFNIMKRFNKTIDNSFEVNGVLLEKYNVCQPEVKAGGGEYDVQLGFGWTNGVYTRFKTLLKR